LLPSARSGPSATNPDRLAGSAGAAVGVAAVLMVIAAAENTVAPWAPFYVVYATLTLLLPFVFGSVTIAKVRVAKWPFWIAALGLALLLQGVIRLLTGMVDLPGMFGAMFEVAGRRLGRPPVAVAKAYLLMITIWAGLGEELFYRGYLQARLRRRFGAVTAIAIASAIFALRHYTQVLLAWPHIDWTTATVWVASTFIVGVVLGWLYEKSASLLPPILCHYVVNLLA
jgi:membrane protease YdiL (CAAX protease family)